MMKRVLFGLLLVTAASAWPDSRYPGLQVEVKRDGSLYTFIASFDTTLTRCAAYRYLTDYEAAKALPDVVESLALRESANKVRVERTADEHVLFFHVRLHSVMEYTEKPFDSVEFTQLSGDSKMFRGDWIIEPNRLGSTLKFHGTWQPDTLIPLFIIDHFAKNGLLDSFSDMAQLAERRKDILSARCEGQQAASNAIE
ncbi:SRPBCC family protein [Sideroxydans lithotrophicus]|uniref:Cyclase/dehydrase n=1 Tax=Sideroxydans lithotrophicus (strain ES-1) TaxID=580332 RepID=D5CPI4_SIDLE|nr:SRPBCC family protein [Sideroxydans lithotrophicus]ADE12979.1 cyclase/dehydrase [Sideroxydans lithotrophicus ES-1]